MMTHGASRHHRKTPELSAYSSAKQRCTNPKNPFFKDYGGRGIKFLFTSFEQFFAHIGPRPEGMSLDRIETNGNYELGNVRWATCEVQLYNRRCNLAKPWKEMTLEERRARHNAQINQRKRERQCA